jgi:hypothetical protein
MFLAPVLVSVATWKYRRIDEIYKLKLSSTNQSLGVPALGRELRVLTITNVRGPSSSKQSCERILMGPGREAIMELGLHKDILVCGLSVG